MTEKEAFSLEKKLIASLAKENQNWSLEKCDAGWRNPNNMVWIYPPKKLKAEFDKKIEEINAKMRPFEKEGTEFYDRMEKALAKMHDWISTNNLSWKFYS